MTTSCVLVARSKGDRWVVGCSNKTVLGDGVTEAFKNTIYLRNGQGRCISSKLLCYCISDIYNSTWFNGRGYVDDDDVQIVFD